MKNSAYFGQLLKAGISSISHCEGVNAAVIEEELGNAINRAGYSIQRYKSGSIPSDPSVVRVLAEACVNRGHLNLEWLKKFLSAARYHDPKEVIESLYPSMSSSGGEINSNLPSPTYMQFVGREREYIDVIEGMKHKSAIIMIHGMGGVGKTSLAYEVARRCLDGYYGAPRFDACVWISDKDYSGRVNIHFVLDEIARTLNYPGVTQMLFEEKQAKVFQLLRQRKILVIIDNFESITDPDLMNWISCIEDPSKVLITTREKIRKFHSMWEIDLSGMVYDEAREFFVQKSLFLELKTDINCDFDLLMSITLGNPKAIEMILGFVKYESVSVSEALEEVKSSGAGLFDYLFDRAWSLINKSTRQIWLSIGVFSSKASHAAVEHVSGVNNNSFRKAVAKLIDLSLVEEEIIKGESRFSLHPLARVFVERKLQELPEIEQNIRSSWIIWCCSYVHSVGWCWNDLKRLDLLDMEHESIFGAIKWAYDQKRYRDVLSMIEAVRYYYNVRGMWDDRLVINMWRAVSARKIGDNAQEALGLAHHVEIHCKQGNMYELEYFLVRLEEILLLPNLPSEVVFEIRHAQALYALENKNIKEAEIIWRDALLIENLVPQMYIIARRWIATCRYKQGDLLEAEKIYHDSFQDAIDHKDHRTIMGNALRLGSIALQNGDVAKAEKMLEICRLRAEEYRDGRRLAEMYMLRAKIQIRMKKFQEAQSSLNLSLDLSERLGVVNQMKEAKEMLDGIRRMSL